MPARRVGWCPSGLAGARSHPLKSEKLPKHASTSRERAMGAPRRRQPAKRMASQRSLSLIAVSSVLMLLAAQVSPADLGRAGAPHSPSGGGHSRERKQRETADRQGRDPGQDAVTSVASCQWSCEREGDENRPTRQRRAVELSVCFGTAVLPTSCACGRPLPSRGVHCPEASASWALGPGWSRSRAQERGSRWSRPQRARSGPGPGSLRSMLR